jgi:hypothetical protein
MFKAELRKNQNGNYDAVAVRQSFDNFAPNQSMATYLEENYKADRLEDLYGRFKTATDVAGLTADIANATGADFLINLPQENLSALRNTTEILTDSVLQPTEEPNRVIGGADYYSQESDGKGLVTGYENNTTTAYMYGDKRIDNTNRLGVGVSVMQMSASYDNGADRDETFINMFIPWMHKLSDKLHFASIFTLGYGFGDYDRGNNQEADIKDYVYGSTNKLVYSMNLADYAELEPSLILNVIGYYQDDMNENDLQISGGNHLSVEGGAGLFVKKELMDSKYGKLTARLGGVYYHEFAEPYKNIRAGFRGGQGSFTINDFANIYNRDRAVLSAALNWDYKQINLYARYQQMLQELDTKNFDLGVKYNF